MQRSFYTRAPRRYLISSDSPPAIPEHFPPHLLSLLPEFKASSSLVGDTCLICQDDITLNSRLTLLPCCHQFHSDCLLPWLSRKQTCPVCRNGLLEMLAQCDLDHEQQRIVQSHIDHRATLCQLHEQHRRQQQEERRPLFLRYTPASPHREIPSVIGGRERWMARQGSVRQILEPRFFLNQGAEQPVAAPASRSVAPQTHRLTACTPINATHAVNTTATIHPPAIHPLPTFQVSQPSSQTQLALRQLPVLPAPLIQRISPVPTPHTHRVILNMQRQPLPRTAPTPDLASTICGAMTTRVQAFVDRMVGPPRLLNVAERAVVPSPQWTVHTTENNSERLSAFPMRL